MENPAGTHGAHGVPESAALPIVPPAASVTPQGMISAGSTPPAEGTVALAQELGLPGIADIHVHFMHPRVMAAVWRYFDSAGPKLGRVWPIRYRGSDAERVEFLRSQGVSLFAGLSYAHRPGVAESLNAWSLEFASQVPEAMVTGTFYPEPGVLDYVTTAIEMGCQLFKIHLQVGDFDPADPQLDPVWDTLSAAGVPVIVHAGSGPVAGRFTGPDPIAAVLTRRPDLPLIIAHLGSPEERDFVGLALRHPHVGLDLTMVDTDFMSDIHRLDRRVLPLVRELGLAGRVFYGTDFPNIPYPYGHQLDVIRRWDLGDEWLRAVLWHNAVALFGAG